MDEFLAGIDPGLKDYITRRCEPPVRKMYEYNLWIAFNVMGWKLCRDSLQNWFWETGDPVRPFWSDHPVNFWRSLDACAVAEKKIAEMGLSGRYEYELKNAHYTSEHGEVPHFMAHARQRCEAMYAIRERIAKLKLTKAEG